MFIASGLLEGMIKQRFEKKKYCERLLFVPSVPASAARLINDGAGGADSEEDDILVAQSIFQSLLIDR